MTLSVCFVLLAAFLWAETPAPDKAKQDAIQRAKNVAVSSLDGSLPKVSLEFFLSYEAAGAAIQWELHDCGERTGNPSTDRVSSVRSCVEADFEKDQTAVTILLSVETFKTGLSGIPALVSVTVDNPNGRSHSLRLGDLPKELHRPAPRMLRDLLVPATASFESPCAAPGACWRPA